ncbi:hypothetical protein GJ744_006853 [Endocarpon pusillum]|uniref:Acyl-CoA thioesterase-like N-terminal HotDog domain-containing protein n=1 Tax=Endocarpon pusillum TaxID=364733 RepID=A0A8H7E5R8_9EURO|nr:hypothetical protein GJ744_006853 [Endocarpon pusillum]
MSSSSGLAAPLPFYKLMALEASELPLQMRSDGLATFKSMARAWVPGTGNTAFGGHIYAQAAWAASKTVVEGMIIHNMTGFFVLPGRADLPFTYKVRRVRDGGIYCLRAVEVYQTLVEERSESTTSNATKQQTSLTEGLTEAKDMAPCFTATVSFKRREDPGRYIHFRYQTPHVSAGHLRKTYGKVLSGRRPEDQPIAPGIDSILWTRGLEADLWEETGLRFPGVEVRKVDMASSSTGNPDRVGEWRQLSFYRLIKDDDDDDAVDVDGDDSNTTSTLNLHACAHLYASDRNSLFVITNALNLADQLLAPTSLSHTVIFHGDPAALSMCDRQGRPIWFLQEAWTENGGSNRGCHESRLWRCDDDGRDEIIATTKQDGVIRVPADALSFEELEQQIERRRTRSGKAKL